MAWIEKLINFWPQDHHRQEEMAPIDRFCQGASEKHILYIATPPEKLAFES